MSELTKPEDALAILIDKACTAETGQAAAGYAQAAATLSAHGLCQMPVQQKVDLKKIVENSLRRVECEDEDEDEDGVSMEEAMNFIQEISLLSPKAIGPGRKRKARELVASWYEDEEDEEDY